jgi:hypothetical protein
MGHPAGHALHGKDTDQGPHAYFAYSAVVIDESLPAEPSLKVRYTVRQMSLSLLADINRWREHVELR